MLSGYDLGYSAFNLPAIVARSVLACETETPGFSLPNASIIRVSRLSITIFEERNGHADVGMYTSLSTGYCGTGGSTPTTVWTLSFISNVFPTMSGSEPNLFFQYSWLKTSTGGAPSLSSSGKKVRPIKGLT